MTNPASIPDLVIGDLRFSPPIIQGGMGVRISGPNLASAVSNEGALGVIAAVGTGEEMTDRNLSYLERSRVSLREMLRDTKKRTSNPIGINIMCALRNYADLVQVAEEEGVDVIISGAGLPLKLPGMISDPHIKLIPIVSSGKAADLICRTWKKRHNRLPDAMVVEGPRAGGHLGFKLEDLDGNPAHDLDILVKDVLEVAAKHGGDKPIPVIAAGGVFDGKDIAHFLAIGASGVQMGTRFVCTHECDASDAYKQAYIDSREEDIMLIESPLGLPLRVVKRKRSSALIAACWPVTRSNRTTVLPRHY
jgi:nitronate monooxygenase